MWLAIQTFSRPQEEVDDMGENRERQDKHELITKYRLSHTLNF